MFVLANAAITWKSQKQPTIALSSTEAEYMAEAIWLKRLYHEMCNLIPGSTPTESTPTAQLIRMDSQSAMKLAKTPVHHDRTKHIDVRHHSIRNRSN